jgi:hypothetical protein
MYFCPRPSSLRVDVSPTPSITTGFSGVGNVFFFFVFGPLLSVGPCMRESILTIRTKNRDRRFVTTLFCIRTRRAEPSQMVIDEALVHAQPRCVGMACQLLK